MQFGSNIYIYQVLNYKIFDFKFYWYSVEFHFSKSLFFELLPMHAY